MAAVVNWARHDAVLFDLDGVVTPTADLHCRAWADVLGRFGFTTADYLAHVDGRPRDEGIRAFLGARDIDLPTGDPSDPPGTATVWAIANRKQECFVDLLASRGIAAYPGSLAVLDHLRSCDVRTAVVSSSANTRQVLTAAGLDGRFDVVVDRDTATRCGFAGKPRPDTYLGAAAMLGARPDRVVVVEDAVSGIEAGVAGGFRLVIGVARRSNVRALIAAGADLVVDDLDGTVEP